MVNFFDFQNNKKIYFSFDKLGCFFLKYQKKCIVCQQIDENLTEKRKNVALQNSLK
jgi:hypothetical protein